MTATTTSPTTAEGKYLFHRYMHIYMFLYLCLYLCGHCVHIHVYVNIRVYLYISSSVFTLDTTFPFGQQWCFFYGCQSVGSFVCILDLPRASLVAQRVKRLPAMWKTQVWSLGWNDPLEKEMATHSSILAWRIPGVEEPGRLLSAGSQRVGHDWVTWLSFFRFAS